MTKGNLATAIGLWGLCLALGFAGAVNAKTIELRDLRAMERHSITESTPGLSFGDHLDFSVADASQVESFGATLDLSIFSFDLLGIDDFSATLQRLGARGFKTVATSFDGPVSFDDLLGPDLSRSGSGSRGSGGSPPAAAVAEADVWVMLLVGFGVVLYQLHRKQRTLEQESVAT